MPKAVGTAARRSDPYFGAPRALSYATKQQRVSRPYNIVHNFFFFWIQNYLHLLFTDVDAMSERTLPALQNVHAIVRK